MIGHLARRARAATRALLIQDFADFCEEQDVRIRATLAEFEARRVERDEDPYIREWDAMDPVELEIRR